MGLRGGRLGRRAMAATLPAALARFGEGIGTAFQLVDDALDYAADPEKLGKRLGADLVEGKATLPLIRALVAEPALRDRLAPIADGADPTDEVCLEVIAAVKRSGGVEAARALAREHTRSALAALETRARRRAPPRAGRGGVDRSPSGRSDLARPRCTPRFRRGPASTRRAAAVGPVT